MSGIFRDPSEGAKARRLDLLRKRRDELVTLPHIVRRVVVARSARIAASVAVCIGGVALLAAAYSPDLAEWLADGLPGQRPAPLSTLLVATWILGIATYAVARSVAEHRFAVAMSRLVLPGEDLNHDLERLSHEHPDDAAKHMAHRLEVRSTSLPILAASVLLPVSLMYAVMAVRQLGWPSPNGFEAAIANHSSALIATALAGLVTAIAMTRAWLRAPRIAHFAGALSALAVIAVAIASAKDAPTAAWTAFAPGLCAALVAVLVRRLRTERTRIAAVDPAAGSEIFTLRGLLRSIRAAAIAVSDALTVDNLRAVARRTRGVFTCRRSRRLVIASAAVIGLTTWGAIALLSGDAADARRSTRAVSHGGGIDMQSAPSEPTTWQVREAPAGQFEVEVTLGDMSEVEIPSLAGIDEIPAGWELVVTVRAYDMEFGADDARAVFVTPVLDPVVTPRQLSESLTSVDFVIDNCDDMQMPLGLRIRPYGDDWTRGDVIQLSVEPRLRLATCRNPVEFDD